MIYWIADGRPVRVRNYRCQECGSTNTNVERERNSVLYHCLDCGITVVKSRVKQCPTCGSTDLYYEAGLITGQKYHCKRCHYIGPLVFEKEVIEKLKE